MTIKELQKKLNDATAVIDEVALALEEYAGGDPPPPPPGPMPPTCYPVVAGEVFQQDGLVFTAGSHNGTADCEVRFALPRTQYQKVTVQFDLFVPPGSLSDPEGKTHFPLLWLQPAKEWKQMLAYLLSVPSSKALRFSSNFLDLQPPVNTPPRMEAGRTYRVTMVIDLPKDDLTLDVRSIDGGPSLQWTRLFFVPTRDVLKVNKARLVRAS